MSKKSWKSLQLMASTQTATQKENFDTCVGKFEVKRFIEKRILLNFVSLSTIFFKILALLIL